MRKLKTMSEGDLITFALAGVESKLDSLQDAIREMEETGEDFHPIEAEWNRLDAMRWELVNRAKAV